MSRYTRKLEIVFFASALLLSSSHAQLHAKLSLSEAPPFQIEQLAAFLKWHMTKIAEIERDEAFVLAPGN